MGKKGGVGYGGNKKPPPTSGLLQHGKSQPATLRQQSGKGGGPGAAIASSQVPNPSNQATALRADHLLRVATWASANVPPLGALLGARLGCLCEGAGVPVPDTAHVICERCESILQVGVNCSVRITKNKRKGKSSITSNYVTYICHFCKHGNAKPGTSKNHLKTMIAQAAARSSLNLLGKSSVVETRPVDKRSLSVNLKKENEQRPAEDNSVQILLENQQRSIEQECPEAVETTLIIKGPLDVPLEGFAEQEGSIATELSLEKGSSDLMETSQQGLTGQGGSEAVGLNLKEKSKEGFAELEGASTGELTHDMGTLDALEKNQMESAGQVGAGALEVTLNREPLDITEEDQPEQTVEVILGQGPSDLLDSNQQDFTRQEDPKAVEVDLNKEHLDPTGENEQRFVEQEGPKTVEDNLNKRPLERTGKNEQGFAEQDGLITVVGNLGEEPVENAGTNERGFAEQENLKSTGTGLNRLPLDLSSKKKRKKKNQQGVVEQEAPKMSLHKGLALESSGSAKKKKRKSWSTLKELASLP